MNKHTRFLLAFASLGTLAAAQTFRTLPAYADAVDGHQSLGLPFGTPAFRTQILVGASALAQTGASLTSISFRADRWLASSVAMQVPNVTVSLSHTNVPALS